MKIIATTVIRNSPISLDTLSGRVIEIDWMTETITKSMPAPLPMHPTSDDNPRGGLRGGRGAKIFDDMYYVANYDTVYVYTADWQLQYQISHPLAIDIHEIDVDAEGVWLSCSRYDLAIKLDRTGNLLSRWHISDSAELMRQLGIMIPPIDYSVDYRERAPKGLDFTHLNCVQIGRNHSLHVHLGQVLPDTIVRKIIRKLIGTPGPKAKSFSPMKRKFYETMIGAKSHIVEIPLGKNTTPKIVASYPALRPNHNGQQLTDNTWGIMAESGELIILDSTGNVRKKIRIPGTWFRGLDALDQNRVIVGTAPCAIMEIDIDSGKIMKRLSLSENPNEAVHGLLAI